MKLFDRSFRFASAARCALLITILSAAPVLAAEGDMPAPVAGQTESSAQARSTAKVPQVGTPQSGAPTATAAASAGAEPDRTIPRKKPGRFSQLLARLQLGVKPAFSRTLSARARTHFGDGGLSLRPSYFRLRVPVTANELGWDYGFSRAKFNENRMTMITVGAGYQHNFRVAPSLSPDATEEEKAAWRASLGSYPYVGLGLNLVATKLRVPDEGLDTDFKLGLGATVTAGYQIKTRLRMQGSVTGMTSVSGYNFSSMRVALDYKM